MNFFKSEWIILSIKKINEKESLYKIFFREYGKIMVKKQKKNREKNLDVGYRVSCEIITHNSSEKILPSISNINIISYFKSDWKKYSEIEWYLKTLAYLENQLPEWMPHWELYNLVENLHLDIKLTKSSYLLFRLKILSYSWTIEISKEEVILYKIVQFVQTNGIKDILRLKEVPKDIEDTLEQIL